MTSSLHMSETCSDNLRRGSVDFFRLSIVVPPRASMLTGLGSSVVNVYQVLEGFCTFFTFGSHYQSAL